MENKVVNTIIGAVALSGTALAGPVVESTTPETNCGNWCETLKTIGKVYKDSNNPYIQELTFFGRAQLQYAYVDGSDVNGQDFSADFEEIRRLRFGGKVKFLNGFELKANANFEDDDKPTGGPRGFGYENFDEAKLSYSFKDAFGLDKVKLSYGRHKIAVGNESHTSSKKIKTVERSALANKIYDNRYTGFLATAEKGGVSGTIGLLSLESSDFVSGWDAGTALYLSSEFEALQGDVTLDFFYNMDADGSGDDEVGVGYEWVASAAWEGTVANNWNLVVNAVYGDNGDVNYAGADRDGSFYGLVVMPSTFLIDDKLEFVARYQFQGSSSSEGIRLNSRYTRRAEGAVAGVDFNGGRGDAHHSLYAGLNWYQCGNNSKFMLGFEWETLSTPSGDADTATTWLAYRMYF